MSEQHIILRRTTLNGVVIEDARFIGMAPTRKQAEEIASIFEDDPKIASKALVGFAFYFYVRSYE
jgi:hypothetical protein